MVSAEFVANEILACEEYSFTPLVPTKPIWLKFGDIWIYVYIGDLEIMEIDYILGGLIIYLLFIPEN